MYAEIMEPSRVKDPAPVAEFYLTSSFSSIGRINRFIFNNHLCGYSYIRIFKPF